MTADLATYLRDRRDRVLICDGAMGSQLLAAGLSEADYDGHAGCHEFLNLSRPDVVAQVHREYLAAGAQLIETNTFGGAAHVLADHGLSARCAEINRAAARLARGIADAFTATGEPRFVAGSVGPGSKLPSLGQVTFDELVASYTPQVRGLLEGGVDCLVCETAQDLLQLKAAIVTAHEVSPRTPIIAQVTLDATERTLTGSDIATVLGMLEALPVLAIGLNCGLGPDRMSEAIHYLSAHSTRLLSVMPNAGLPRLVGGHTVYSLGPGEFARQMRRYAERPGLDIAGGCCGTTPEHIRALVDALRDVPARVPAGERRARLTSLFQAQDLDVSPKPLILGERTNASGSRAFRDLLLQEDFEAMAAVALEQEREGAHAIDLSLAAAGRDEAADVAVLAASLNQRLRVPVMIDSTAPAAIEAALKRLAGRSAVNSVHLERGEDAAGRIIALCARYGAALVCLAIDERGMAMTAAHKVEVATRLRDLALAGGLSDADLFFDLLTFTLGSGEESLRGTAVETLDAVRRVKALFPRAFTSLGVSNVSYGLPQAARPYLNSVFLHHALEHGLDAAIVHAGRIHPLHRIPLEIRRICDDLVFDRSSAGARPLDRLLEHVSGANTVAARVPVTAALAPEKRLKRQVVDGDASELDALVRALLERHDPTSVIQTMLLPGMDEVGRLFSRGHLALPFVLRSADVVRRALELLAPRLGKEEVGTRGVVVLATVRDDIHDIGKNLVDLILTANGYRVVNLGIRQSAEDILTAARTHGPDAIGLSGLLVESVRAMTEYLEIFAEAGLDVPVICGGAALSRRIVEEAMCPLYPAGVHYARDAMDGLRLVGEIVGGRGRSAGRGSPGRAVRMDLRPEAGPWSGIRTALETTVIDRVPADPLFGLLDRKALFGRRWGLGRLSQKQRLEAETRLVGLWHGLEPAIRPRAVYLIARRGELDRAFESHILSGRSALGLQVVTIGNVSRVCGTGTAEERFLLHGLAAELAEALARWCHARIEDEAGWVRSRRISPGFPAWPDLSEQRKVFRLLRPGRIGVRLGGGFQMIPEYSTSAAVLPL